MSSVDMKKAKNKFHAADKLEVHASPKPCSSNFFCLGYLLPSDPGEEQRGNHYGMSESFLFHYPSSKRPDSSFGLQSISQEDLSTSEMKTGNQLFLSPDHCNLFQNNSHYNQTFKHPISRKKSNTAWNTSAFIVIVQLH